MTGIVAAQEKVVVHGKTKRKSAALRRSVWSAGSSMERAFPLLAMIAIRLLSLHATSCGTERNWSNWRWVCRDKRRRLAFEKVSCLGFALQKYL